MKKAFLFLTIILVVLTGCSKIKNNPFSNEKLAENKAGLANPASVNCEEKGGFLEMRENENGQYGVCIFDDMSECEEWAFFREECKKGDSLKQENSEQNSEVKKQEDKEIKEEKVEEKKQDQNIEEVAQKDAETAFTSLDTSDWRTYIKEDKNIEIKYHKNWYFNRPLGDSGYILHVGFGDDASIFDSNDNFDIEMFVLDENKDLEKTFQYSKEIKKVDGKKIIIATNNKAEFGDIMNSMISTFKYINNN